MTWGDYIYLTKTKKRKKKRKRRLCYNYDTPDWQLSDRCKICWQYWLQVLQCIIHLNKRENLRTSHLEAYWFNAGEGQSATFCRNSQQIYRTLFVSNSRNQQIAINLFQVTAYAYNYHLLYSRDFYNCDVKFQIRLRLGLWLPLGPTALLIQPRNYNAYRYWVTHVGNSAFWSFCT